MASLSDQLPVFGGSGDDALTGSIGADVIHGDAGDDTLSGAGGADTLIGGLGGDLLFGGTGANVLYGGAGDDILTYDSADADGDLQRLFGGEGSNTLVLEFTQEDYLAPGVIAEVLAYSNALAAGENPGGGAEFVFQTFALRASNFSSILIFVDGDPIAPGEVPGVDAVDDAFAVAEGGTVAGDVTLNDNVPAGAVVSLVTPPVAGQLSLQSDGSFTFDASGAFETLSVGDATTVTFTYRLSDDDDQSDGAVTITIEGENDAPTAGVATDATGENQILNGDLIADSGAADVDRNDVLSILSVNGQPLGGATQQITLASGAVLTVTPAGGYAYDPGAAFDILAVGDTATETIAFVITDGQGGEVASTLTLTINGENDAPFANADVAATTEEDAVTFDVVGNDTDVDQGDVLTLVSIDGITGGGTATITPTGQIEFDPLSDFQDLSAGANAFVDIEYTIEDASGARSSSTATVTVTGVNDAPTGDDIDDATSEDANLTGNLLAEANADDIDSADVLTILAINDVPFAGGFSAQIASGAMLTVMANGDYTYSPTSGFNGLSVGETASDSFAFTISDGRGGAIIRTFSIDITGENDGPVAQDFTVLVNENDTAAIDFLADSGAFDPDDNGFVSLTAINGTPLDPQTPFFEGSNGGVLFQGSGGLTFDVFENFEELSVGDTGTTTFTFTIEDDQGVAITRTLTVEVAGTNDDPTANPVDFQTDEDTPATGNLLSDSGAFDIDQNDTLVVTEILADGLNNGALNGAQQTFVLGNGATLTVAPDGAFTFQPSPADQALTPDEQNTERFAFRISDGQGGEIVVAVDASVEGVNDDPTADAITRGALEDDTVFGDLLADSNAADVDDGDVLRIAEVEGQIIGTSGDLIAGPDGGTLFVSETGGYTFNPNGDFEFLSVGDTATSSFAFLIADDFGGFVDQTITFEVAGANDAPTVEPVGIATDEDNATSGNLLTEGSADDIDQNDTLSLTDIFFDGVIDGALNGATRIFTLPSGAQLTVSPDGSYTYDPLAAFQDLQQGQDQQQGDTDTDFFTFRIADGNGGVATESATISISGVNDAPTLDPIAVTIGENDSDEGDLVGDSNAADVDQGDTVTIFTLEGQDFSAGTVTITRPGEGRLEAEGSNYTYETLNDFDFLSLGDTATTEYEFTVTDSFGATATTTITFTITGENDGPTANDFSQSTTEDDVLSRDLLIDSAADDVDQNDTLTISRITIDGVGVFDLNGAPVTETLANGAILTVNPDGTYQVDPAGNFEALAPDSTSETSFSFTISDGNGGEVERDAVISITGVNDAPVAVDDTATTDQDSQIPIDPVTNDSDVDGSFMLTSFTQPDNGGVVAFGQGLEFDPNGDFDFLGDTEQTTTTFTYTITDDFGATDTADFTITVTGLNDAPVVTPLDATTDEDRAAFMVDLLAGQVDVDQNDVLSVENFNEIDTTFGGFTITGATFTFDARQFDSLNAGESQEISYEYDVVDLDGARVTNTLTLTVEGRDESLNAVDDSFSTDEDTTLSGDVSVNDTVGTGTFSLDQNVGAGLLILNGDGSFTFDPNGDFDFLADGETDSVSFSYIIDDGVQTSTATATIDILGLNDGPDANDVLIDTDEDNTVSVNLIDESNAFDPDATGPIELDSIDGVFLPFNNDDEIIMLSSGATITASRDGEITYDPIGFFEELSDGDFGFDSFTFELVDDFGDALTLFADVDILGVNDAVQAEPASFNADEDNGASDNLLDLSNFFDPDLNDEILIGDVNGNDVTGGVTITLGSGAQLTIDEFGDFTYDTNGQFEGLAAGETDDDSFTYTITDGFTSVDLTSTIIVDGVNDAPVIDLNDSVLSDTFTATGGAGGSAVVSAIQLDGTNGFALIGEGDLLASGAAVAGGGDFDGDGIDDVVVGSPGFYGFYASGTGSAFVLFGQGATPGPATRTIPAVTPDSDGLNFVGGVDERLGRDAAFVGDVNGDGLDDFLIANGAAPYSTQAGVVRLILGQSPTSFGYQYANGSNSTLFIDSSTAYSGTRSLGASVASAGDVNGDGINDFIIGAPFDYALQGDQDFGKAYVVFGRAAGGGDFGATFDLATLDGTEGFRVDNGFGETGTRLGSSVSGIGDVNGDGFDDVLIGARRENEEVFTPPDNLETFNTGAAYVIFGTDNGFDASIDVTNLAATDGFRITDSFSDSRIGAEVSGAGDFNGDGLDDYVISAQYYQPGASRGGYEVGGLYVIYGNDNQAPGELDLANLPSDQGFKIIGPAGRNAYAGESLAAAGDFNGDGFDDIIIGADGDYEGLNTGEAFVLFGTDQLFASPFDLSDFDADDGVRLIGVAAGDLFGSRVSGAGDLNQDGYDDVIVGASSTGANDPGAAYVFFGQLGGGSGAGGPVGGTGAVFFDDVDLNDEHVLEADPLNNDDDFVIVDFELITDSTGGVTGEAEWTASIEQLRFDELAEGETLTEGFNLTVDDQNGGVDTVQLDVTFIGVNDAPTSEDVAQSIGEDVVLANGDLLAASNAMDIDAGDMLRVSSVIVFIDGSEDTIPLSASPSVIDINGAGLFIDESGNFSIDQQGAFDFLDDGQRSTIRFDFVVADQSGASSRSSAVITVNGENDDPIAVDDTATTEQNDAIIINVFENDIDPEGGLTLTSLNTSGALGSIAIESATAGTVVFNPNGAFDFLDSGEDQTDTFTYTLIDSGGVEATAQVDVTVLGQNDAPVARDSEEETSEDDTIAGSFITDSGSFDPDTSDTLVVQSVDGVEITTANQTVVLASGSTLIISPNGDFTYNPRTGNLQTLAQGASGDEDIAIVLSDGDLTDASSLLISVTGVNDAPTATPLARTTDEDEPAFVVDLLANAADVDQGDVLSIQNFTENQTLFGIASQSGTTATFDATFFDNLAAGETQIINYTYDIVDSAGARVATTLELTIEGRDEALLAVDDAFSTDEDTTISGDVSTNDTAQSGVFSLVTTPNGDIIFNDDGTFDYDPTTFFNSLDEGAQQDDTFTYQIDNGTDQVTAEVTITVDGINDAPGQIIPSVTNVDLVTLNDAGDNGGNLSSLHPSITADGQNVSYHSDASNLIPLDNNARTDVYTGDIFGNNAIASVQNGTNNLTTTNGSAFSQVNADGSVIVFHSLASDLVLLDPDGNPLPDNNKTDIYVRDVASGETQIPVPFGFDGNRLNGDSLNADVSANGRFVVFESAASNIIADDDNGAGFDIWLHDRFSEETIAISQSPTRNDALPSNRASISADGSTVVFLSANAYDDNDTNGLFDVYAYDVASGDYSLISKSSAGALGNDQAFSFSFGLGVSTPSVSANGRYVAWTSRASNLVDDDTNGGDDIFVHDRVTGETERVSITFSGGQGDLASFDPQISDDGRYVAFETQARTLDDILPDTNGQNDVYVKDRLTGDLTRISVTPDFAAQPSGGQPAISANGERIAFISGTVGGNFDDRVTTGTIADVYVTSVDTTGFTFSQNDTLAFVDLENEWFDPDGLGLDFLNITVTSDNDSRIVGFNEVLDGGRVIGIDLDPSEFVDLGANDYELLTVEYDLTDGVANVFGVTGVVIIGENDAPTANDQTFEVNQGQSVSGSFIADDIDGDNLTFSFLASALQGDLTLNEDGSFTYAAASDQTSDEFISIDVDDGNGGFTSFLATFDVNQPPIFTAPTDIPVALTDEVITSPDNAIDTSAFFTDPEGTGLTFSAVEVGATRLPRDLVIDAATGIISGTPRFGEAGLPRIAVTATDGNGLSTTGEFWLAIAGEVVTGDANDNNIVDATTTSFIDGLAGNDSITGENNTDIYQYRRGEGFDIIDDNQSGGINRLVMTGYNSDEVQFTRFSPNSFEPNGLDLLITPIGQPVDFTEGVLIRNGLVPTASGVGVLTNFHFDDGVILDRDDAAQQIFDRDSTDGDNDIRGFNSADTLAGGLGDDALSGDDGSDLYIYNAGDGDDTIRDNGFVDNDIIQIGYNLADASFSRIAGTNDLIIDFGGGDRLTVVNSLLSPNDDGIEVFRFLDGDRSMVDIRNIILDQSETEGDDIILGFNANGDTLEGGPGDDSIYGFDGGDTYIYRAGDGDDLIHERGFQDNDILQVFDFTIDYDLVEGRVNAGSQVTFQRGGFQGEQIFQDSSVIINLDNGAGLTGSIDGIGTGNNDQLTSFIFEDSGVTLTAAQIRSDLVRQQETDGDDVVRGFGSGAGDIMDGGLGDDLLLGGDGLDIYRFAAGDGDDTVQDIGFQENDRVEFVDRALADFDIFFDPINNDNVIFTAGTDRIEIIRGLVGGNNNNISFFDFTDQTVSEADMRQIVVDLAVATPGRDLIGATGSQTFASTPGSDRFISGRGSADSYVYAAGDGNDTIFDNNGDTNANSPDIIDLTDFASTDFALAGPNSIRFDPVFEDNVQFFIDANNTLDIIAFQQIEQVVFSDQTFDNDADDTDGATNFRAFIASLVAEAVAADPNEDVITKIENVDPGGNNTFTSTAANEAFFLDGSADDQVVFNVSEIGSDSINNEFATVSGYDITIDFSGIVADTVQEQSVNLSLSELNQHDLIIDIIYQDTADIEPAQGIGRVEERIVMEGALEVFRALDSITVIDNEGVVTTPFANTNEIRQLFIDRAVTAGDDVIPNYFATGLTLRGGGGDDTLAGARGGQIFEFSPGDGRVTVAEGGQSGGGTDTVSVNGFALEDASISRSPTSTAALVFDFGGGDELIVQNFYPGGFVIEQWVFQADATTPQIVTGNEIATEYLSQLATSGDDIIIGGDGRNETLDGGVGDDTLDGQDGSDTYIVRRGEGDKYVRETGSGDTDTLQLDVASTSVTFEQNRVDPNNLILVMDDGTRVEIFNFLEANDGKIEQFVFTDTTLDTTQARILAFDSLATAGDDSIVGGATDDTLRGGQGDDTLRGANGNDTFVYEIGDGNDILTTTATNNEFEFFQITGVDVGDVIFSRVPGSRDLSAGQPSLDEDLLITFANDPGSIRIENGLRQGSDLDRIEITDSGVTLTDSDVFNRVLVNDIVNGRTFLEGPSTGSVIFPTGASFIFAQQQGDIFQFAAGQGTLTILDDAPTSETQRLEILGYSSTDAVFSRLAAGAEDFIIRLPNGDQIIVIGDISGGAPVNGVNEIFFAGDNVTLDDGQITLALDGGMAGAPPPGGGSGGSPRLADPVGDAAPVGEAAVGASEDDVLVLGPGDDVMRLGPGDDFVRGRGGNDALWGQGGDDTLIGNAGADTLRGGRGEDELRGGGGRDKLIGGGDDDVLKGNGGRDVLKGGRGADELKGGVGNDVLKGGGGDDRIEGGKGDDRLTGQGGEDTFVFARGFGSDVIRDFRDGVDVLDFSGHAGVSVFGDLSIAQVSDGAVIADGAGGRIKLLGFDAEDLQGDDFLF